MNILLYVFTVLSQNDSVLATLKEHKKNLLKDAPGLLKEVQIIPSGTMSKRFALALIFLSEAGIKKYETDWKTKKEKELNDLLGDRVQMLFSGNTDSEL